MGFKLQINLFCWKQQPLYQLPKPQRLLFINPFLIPAPQSLFVSLFSYVPLWFGLLTGLFALQLQRLLT